MWKLKKLEKLKELSLPMVAEELRRMRNIQDVKAGGYGMTAGISAYVLYQIILNANLNELILLRYCSYQTISKVYHFLYGIPYSSSSFLSKDEDYILPVSVNPIPPLMP